MRKLFTLFCLLFSLNVLAQEKQEISQQDYSNQQVEMADSFRAEGKIYVVVGIIGLILGGLIAYAAIIDRKVSQLEQLVEKESNKHLVG